MNVRIDIDTKTFVRFWLVVIGFVLLAILIYSARTALIIVGISFFLAIALNMPVNKILKILPSRSRSLSTAISYLAVLSVIATIIFLVIPPILEQMVRFTDNLPSLIDSASKQYVGANEFITKHNLQPEVDKIIESVKNGTTQFASTAGSLLITGISSIVFVVVTTILVLVITFLMLVEGPIWLDRFWSLYADKERMHYHRSIVEKMYKVVTNYVIGQLSVAAIAGAVAGLAIFIMSFMFNIPYNLSIPTATIVFVMSLIPMFGAMIGATTVSVILALNDFSAAIVFLVFFIIYQQLEGNYISPKIQSKRMELSALVILVAVTFGIYMFGFLGGLISIPVAGCIGVLAEVYFSKQNKKLEKQKKPAKSFLDKISLKSNNLN
ncbi:MAG TPA: AI-2E family transporter [Candidatus Saccharibacteria bacterium]|nr:AI-2E family transporter [Candidatus Saccharibacteria bacterium]